MLFKLLWPMFITCLPGCHRLLASLKSFSNCKTKTTIFITQSIYGAAMFELAYILICKEMIQTNVKWQTRIVKEIWLEPSNRNDNETLNVRMISRQMAVFLHHVYWPIKNAIGRFDVYNGNQTLPKKRITKRERVSIFFVIKKDFWQIRKKMFGSFAKHLFARIQ